MAKKMKRIEPKYRVQITMRGQAAEQVDGLIQTGFYGTNRSKAISRLVSEALMAKLEDTKSNYRVVLQAYGYPAYVIEKLVDVIGNDKKEVLEQIVQEWLSGNWQRLSNMGITVSDARAEGYIQGKVPTPFRVMG